jgi:hypothetical protein
LVIVPEPGEAFAVSVLLLPAHIAVGDKLGAADGAAFTVTVKGVTTKVQPLLLVTVTEYVVVPAGDTEPLATLPRPALHA